MADTIIRVVGVAMALAVIVLILSLWIPRRKE